jgi:hypothetical protein
MKIEKYVASLLPSIRKDKVLDDIAAIRKELRDATIPAYSSIAVVFGKWKWQSDEMKGKATAFSRLVGGGNLVEVIGHGLDKLDASLTVAEEFIMKTYNEETVTSAITYKKAAVLQYVDAISFVVKYARRFANYMLVCEAAKFPDSDTSLSVAFAPAEIGYIEGNFMMFCQAFKALAIEPKEVQKRIDETPDIIVKASAAGMLEEIHGAARVDAFGMNFISSKWNPFYHIGKAFAEFQVSSYKAAREELALVQMRKLYLEKLQAKKPDAALAQEIEYSEGRLQSLHASIAKMEAAYA